MAFQKNISIQDRINQLLALHNKARAKANLHPLKINNKLVEYAQFWANEMAKGNLLVHSNMQDILNIGFIAVGENVAWNQDSTYYVTDCWLRSPGHRENIMKPFTQVGFGVACNSKNQPYWCAVFAD
jgi:uncharacterized protein YkwD